MENKIEPLNSEIVKPIPNIYQRILMIMGELDYIQKGEKEAVIGPQRYTFVSHDQVTAAIHPLLVKYGVVIIPNIEDLKQDANRTIVKLALVFRCADNPNDAFVSYWYGYGIDTGDKGTGKAVSYAYKYGILKTFCLETGDDPDKDQNAAYEPAKCLQFDSMLPMDISEKEIAVIKKFLKAQSKTLKLTEEELKSHATSNMPDFLAAVKKWELKNKEKI